MARAESLDDIPASGRSKRRRVNEIVDVMPFPDKKWLKLRLMPKPAVYGTHWVKTKRKDGSPTSFPTPCLAFDPETRQIDTSKKCPWCKSKSDQIRSGLDVYANAIIRSIQKQAPEEVRATRAEKESGFKDKESETFTIYRVVQIPSSVIGKLKDLKALNTHEDENGDTQGYGVDHARFGRDISIMFDSSKAGTDKYAVQMGDHTPLKKSEKLFLQWDLSNLVEAPPLAEAEADYKSWASRNGEGPGGGGDDDDEMPKRKKKPVDDDDDDDIDLTPQKKKRVADDDEDLAPPKKKKAAPVEDDDDDFDPPPKKKKAAPVDDDDDEDEAPPKKAVKKKVVEDDDDDFDPPPKKKKAAPVDDDDEDEAPPPKKRKAAPVEDEDDEDEPPPKKPAAKKKAAPVDDDDDEDDAAPPTTKPAATKKVVDDDDDDFDPPPKKKRKVVDDDDEDL